MRSEQNVDCLFFFAQFILLPISEQIKTTPSVLLLYLLLFLCLPFSLHLPTFQLSLRYSQRA